MLWAELFKSVSFFTSPDSAKPAIIVRQPAATAYRRRAATAATHRNRTAHTPHNFSRSWTTRRGTREWGSEPTNTMRTKVQRETRYTILFDTVILVKKRERCSAQHFVSSNFIGVMHQQSRVLGRKTRRASKGAYEKFRLGPRGGWSSTQTARRGKCLLGTRLGMVHSTAMHGADAAEWVAELCSWFSCRFGWPGGYQPTTPAAGACGPHCGGLTAASRQPHGG